MQREDRGGHGHQWLDAGCVDVLAADHRVLAIDRLGHGRSDKPHVPAVVYGDEGIVEDIGEDEGGFYPEEVVYASEHSIETHTEGVDP